MNANVRILWNANVMFIGIITFRLRLLPDWAPLSVDVFELLISFASTFHIFGTNSIAIILDGSLREFQRREGWPLSRRDNEELAVSSGDK